MHKIAVTAVGAAALGLTAPASVAATHTTTGHTQTLVTTKRVTGPPEAAGPWGNIVVTLLVKKTTTITGKRTTVMRTITNASVPIYPNHTARSVYINSVALPLLTQETLKAHFNLSKIYLISGASFTSVAFGQSLQAALLAAAKV
jgi:hypothetical protein